MNRVVAAAGEGVRHGVAVWGLYGILEFCFDSVFPTAYEPSHVLTGWHWMIGGVLLACYLVVGIVSGVCVGAAAGVLDWRANIARPVVTLSLVSLVVLQAYYRGLSSASRSVTLAAAIVGCLQLLTLIPRMRRGPVWYLAHPLIAAIVLAGFPVWRVAPSLEANPVPMASVSATPGAPDVVMLIMDTARARNTSVHGYERDTTPNLRALAEAATVYDRAVAAGNYSLTGHASLLTGSYPRRSGARGGVSSGDTLSDEHKTVAEYLAERGYSTALFGANHAFLTRHYGLVQGFQTYKTPNQLGNPYHLRRIIREGFQHTQFWELQRKYASAETINRLIYRKLDELIGAYQRFFLVVNYMDAHEPLVAPPPYTDMYSSGRRLISNARYHQLADRLRDQGQGPAPEELEVVRAQYDAGIRYTDEQIGELIDYLKRTGRFDNTLFIVTSDHGDHVLEGGHPGHAGDVCELELRIPLVIKYPGQREPAVVRSYASHVDMLPTILDVAGIEVPENLDGVSLARLGVDESRQVLAEDYDRHGRPQRALYSGDCKLISNVDGTFQLFRVDDDPKEEHDLLAEEPEIAGEMVAALDEWLSAIPPSTTHPSKVDEEELERLRGLGYVQ